ncbi:hypothetical protein ALP89_200160 [Pseudomonas syringae pv. persicae]|nr:hypothetical protein ALP89_200160 [Pseudomonas syringae pv. persicae]
MVSPFLVQLRIYYPFSILSKKQLLIPEKLNFISILFYTS